MPSIKGKFTVLIVVVGLMSLFLGEKEHTIGALTSECNRRLEHGRLHVTHVTQQNSSWCWVAAVEEVLTWHELPYSKQCQLYDLWPPRNSCQDMLKDPKDWTGKQGNNDFGAPELAANKYNEKHGGIAVETREQRPLSFDEITQHICPADGSFGKPIIWSYVNRVLNDGTQIFHDVVIYGYGTADLPYLLIHDPEYPKDLEPPVILYDKYADEVSTSNLLISKISQ